MCPAAYRTSCTANASGGVPSVTSDRKYPKSAAKTNGFGILARSWCGMYRHLSPPRIKRCKPTPCFRTVPASIHRDALRACAARSNKENSCAYRFRGVEDAAPTKFYRQTVCRGGCPCLPAGFVPQFLRCVIAKPVRTLAVAIRPKGSPAQGELSRRSRD